MSTTAGDGSVQRLGPEHLEALADQRDFLLRSLEDLEREYEAGDVDDDDYAALRDDYTTRAAGVLRALEQGRARVVRPRRSWGRTAAWVAGVAAFALLAGVLVARGLGRRDSGEVISGDVRTTVTEQLNRARNRAASGDLAGAVELYDTVLETSPDNPEAGTYRGWFLYLSGSPDQGLSQLLETATASPTYPDVHALLTVVFFRSGLADEARRELQVLDRLDAPAGLDELLAPIRAQLGVPAAPG